MQPSVPTSRVKTRLQAGEWVFGASVLADAWHVDMLGRLGFDFAWIDSEHNNLSDRDLPGLCLAARGAGYDPIVRIRKEDASNMYRVLEAGAAGVIVPHCDTPEEARAAVQQAKFPPLGERSYSGMGTDACYGLVSGRRYLEEANQASALVLQIETPRAVANVAEIAAVPGVDILMVGPADLSMNLGIPLEFGHERFKAALREVASACRDAGVHWGLPVGNAAQGREMLELGARFLCFGSPRRILMAGYRNLFDEFAGLRG